MNAARLADACAPGPSAQLEHFRARVKPQLFERLRHAYAQADSDEQVTGALEAELQKIDAHLSEIDSGLLTGEHGSERHDGGLVVLQRDHELALAEASLVYVPCNFDCVHGPFCAQLVAQVASGMLHPGESLAFLERIDWSRPVRRHVRIEVKRVGSTAPRSRGDVSGCFSTSHGSRLDFDLTELPGRYVVEQTRDNVIAQRLLSGVHAVEEEGSCRLLLDTERLSAAERRLLELPGVWLGTLLDLLSILTLNVKRNVPMLACGCTCVPLAGLVPELPRTFELELRSHRHAARRSPRSGLLMVPYEFRCRPLGEDWATWLVAEAPGGAAQMLRILHGR